MLEATTRVAERGTSTNRLLIALHDEDSNGVLDDVEAVDLPVHAVLHGADAVISWVYFPDNGAVMSIIAPLGVDDGVEVGTIGSEGFVGLPIMFGLDHVPFTAVVQVAGTGWRVTANEFRTQLAESAALRSLCGRYAHTYYVQVGQSSACNRAHSVAERCARWLLMMHDRADSGTFLLTQEYLAAMLGVRRAGVTVAAGELQRAGLIVYHRGNITIVDRPGLEAASCGCYDVIRDAYLATFGAIQPG
jgi:CRP-like cAMP-binding protein